MPPSSFCRRLVKRVSQRDMTDKELQFCHGLEDDMLSSESLIALFETARKKKDCDSDLSNKNVTIRVLLLRACSKKMRSGAREHYIAVEHLRSP